jgi:hypothetical protein
VSLQRSAISYSRIDSFLLKIHTNAGSGRPIRIGCQRRKSLGIVWCSLGIVTAWDSLGIGKFTPATVSEIMMRSYRKTMPKTMPKLPKVSFTEPHGTLPSPLLSCCK